MNTYWPLSHPSFVQRLPLSFLSMRKASIISLALIFGLPSLTKGLIISVDDPLVLNSLLICHWKANSSDPDSFVISWAPLTLIAVSQLVQREGKGSGDQTLLPVSILGPHTMAANSSSDTPGILDHIQFNVIAATLSTTSVSNLGRPPTSSISHNHEATAGAIPITLGLATPTDITSSISPTESSPSSHRTKSKVHVSTLVGGTIGALLGLGLVTLWIFWIRLRRRRRCQELNLAATPYKSTSPNRIVEKSGQEGRTLDAIVTTEGQRSLQARVREIERQLEESQAALQNMRDASPESTRALIAENTRLQIENEVLRDWNRSDWALGLTDVLPSSYPHSQASSQ
ncbi:hypothetical protein C8J56DRAFT_1049579 [Mycena floridula]|nr:hypothetical protein C8J56DRAFT_1049579 [Mycena floridula]